MRDKIYVVTEGYYAEIMAILIGPELGKDVYELRDEFLNDPEVITDMQPRYNALVALYYEKYKGTLNSVFITFEQWLKNQIDEFIEWLCNKKDLRRADYIDLHLWG